MSIIEKLIRATFQVVPTHAETLLGQRQYGSQWLSPANTMPGLIKMLGEAMVQERVEEPGMLPDCRYFHLSWDYTIGSTGFRFKPHNDRPFDIHIAEGPHGPELHTNEPRTGTATQEGWMICEMEQGVMVVSTIYPGPMSARIPKSFYEGRKIGDIIDPNLVEPDWAIKYK